MIELHHVTIRTDGFQLNDISLSLPAGAYAVLMGPTGAGKTTLLEAICGLRPLASGSISLHDQDVTNLPVPLRGIGYVPQDLCLFPNLTVQEHLEFGLQLRHWSAAQRRERVTELAELLQIGPLLGRKPKNLSGGESQRVAIGRAIAFRPRILLLDEPLSALDAATRDALHEVLRVLHQSSDLTALHVTHRREEAAPLATMWLTLAEGKITQH